MSTRREFLKQTAAAGVVAIPSARVVPALANVGSGSTSTRKAHTALDKHPRINSVTRREATILRYEGTGDNWHMSWAANDLQYVSLCDGFGFSGQSRFLYNARMLALEGGPPGARFHDLQSYPFLAYSPSQKLADPRYYPFGTLALDGHLYQFMSTFNRGLLPGDLTAEMAVIGKTRPLRFVGVKLIYSPDNGRTWCNQDGSMPVMWESWERRSRDTMLLFEEPHQAFSMTTVLQMGRNYEHNRDGYVYVYGPNGNTEGTMNELVLFRVPKTQIVNRNAYRYFAGLRSDGTAKWTPDIDARKPLHTFPRGWVNTLLHPMSWHPSVVYNAGLGIYMMANWGMGTGADGTWFAKPSYLGFWVAPQPWGPWTQIYEETAWTPGGEIAARAYEPQIAPKWIAGDGKSFWLVWTDAQLKGDEAQYEKLKEPLTKKTTDERTPDDWHLKYVLSRQFNPYYTFNAQRVDLEIA